MYSGFNFKQEFGLPLWQRYGFDLHSDCPPVNQVGLLNPGESRNTGTLNLSTVCRFHDHLNQSDQALKGRIVVQ